MSTATEQFDCCIKTEKKKKKRILISVRCYPIKIKKRKWVLPNLFLSPSSNIKIKCLLSYFPLDCVILALSSNERPCHFGFTFFWLLVKYNLADSYNCFPLIWQVIRHWCLHHHHHLQTSPLFLNGIVSREH